MKIAIFGSREIDTEKVYSTLSKKMTKENEYITSGNISGTAEVAYDVAKEKGIKITLYNYLSGLGFLFSIKGYFFKKQKNGF
jgi:predicted Rossmann fold nucleotide-binding protein DprA/Smf involved in DNA uptake